MLWDPMYTLEIEHARLVWPKCTDANHGGALWSLIAAYNDCHHISNVYKIKLEMNKC